MKWIFVLALLSCQVALSAGSAVPAPAMPGVNVPAIKVNTVGYPSAWPKLAFLNSAPKSPYLRSESGQRIEIAPSAIRAFGLDKNSQDEVWSVDFSAVTTVGRYVLVNGKDESDPFQIGVDYQRALLAGLRHFYFQRCRTELKEPHIIWDSEDDDYSRATACHQHEGVGLDLAKRPERSPLLKPVRGWHDAGNWDIYIPSEAPSAQALLTAFERHPELFGDASGLPESGNGVPDILDEAVWGIDWVASMQTRNGSLRAREAVHKLGDAPEGAADADKSDRWISGPGTASAAKAAAVFAQAERVLRKYPKYSRKAREYGARARQAWNWLRRQKTRVLVESHGSDQPLWDDSTEYSETGARMVASAEMWRTFRDPQALREAAKLMKDKDTDLAKTGPGAWANLSWRALLVFAHDKGAPKDLRVEARQRLLDYADSLRERVEKLDGYRVALGEKDYYWGTPSNLMERTEILLEAAKLDPQGHAWCIEVARDQWHWILGRNPNGYSLVTRVGKGPTRIYHAEYGRKKVPPPGYVIDGPNFSNGAFLSPSAPAKALLWDNPEPLKGSGLPAHAMFHNRQEDLWEAGWVKDQEWTTGWWVVTEPDIYYNANYVIVAAEMAAQARP